jgi:sulfur-oxidizing protein SoxY
MGIELPAGMQYCAIEFHAWNAGVDMVGHVSSSPRPTGLQWACFQWACFRSTRLWLAGIALGLQVVSVPLSFAATSESEDPWAALANEIFKGRPLADGKGLVGIEMPARAEDAAVVPVTMRVALPPGDLRRLKALTLVIDDNPVPVAAAFAFGDNASVSAISTHVRVNSYTDVHVVAELSDGKLYVVKTYVKASGGCAAPAAKNSDEAVANVGQMQLRAIGKATAGPASAPHEAQIMIRHPNNSGLQRDQVSLLYIPANFVEQLRVWQDDALLFSVDAGISISEDPTFRVMYIPNGAATLKVEARDTAGRVFRHEWPAAASPM